MLLLKSDIIALISCHCAVEVMIESVDCRGQRMRMTGGFLGKASPDLIMNCDRADVETKKGS